MQSSEEEEEEELPMEEPPPKRGDPAGRADEKPRYRRTTQEISQDKIRIAQMKLQDSLGTVGYMAPELHNS